MNIQIIVGSIREGRVAIKVAHWLLKEIENLGFSTLNVEIVDLKEWDLPFFAGAKSPATGIYDQPKQQDWADKIASGDAFIFVTPEYNHGYSPVLKMHWIMSIKNGKPNLQPLSAMVEPMVHVQSIKLNKSVLF